MKQIAFLFPGQGAQKVGMGKDIFRAFKAARQVFEMAEDLTGLPIQTLCFEGPANQLAATVNLQPVLTTVNLALLACILQSDIRPALCAGHSLGEYSALAAAKIISDQDCIKLVQKRGELMHREAMQNEGTMYAILGLNINTVSMIVESAMGYGPISIANHNSADQLVITGALDSIECAVQKALALGGKPIPLQVSGAWHSPLINGALNEFDDFLSTIEFKPPQCALFHNVTAATENHPDIIKSLISRQFCSRVKWFETMRNMMDKSVDVYVEIGPGKVLTRLLRKTFKKTSMCRIYNVYNIPTLTAFLEAET